MRTEISKDKSSKSIWTILIYFVLCFFYFGVVMMVRFINYPTFEIVKEHFADFITVFNNRMIWICYFPAILMTLSSLSLLFNSPATFPRWTIVASIGLTLISVATTLFILLPIHSTLLLTGFNEDDYNRLLSVSIIFQVISATLQVIIALFLLNIYFNDTKPLGRWFFIITFSVVFYAAGTDYVEKFINYPSWLTVGKNNWVAFRKIAVSPDFFKVYLIPSYLPLIFTILLFWRRPKGIPKYFLAIVLFCILEIAIITGIYFVPQLQMKLDTTFSRPLIEELIRNDFPLRGIAGLIFYFFTAWGFFKAGQARLKDTL